MKYPCLVLISCWVFFYSSISAAPLPSTDTLSPAAFTESFVKALKQKKSTITTEIVSDLHLRSTVDGRCFNTFLDASYEEYLASQKNISQIISRQTTTQCALYRAGITVDINRIVPLIKPVSFLHDSAGIMADSTLDTANLPVMYDSYNEKLIVLYAQDLATHRGCFSAAEFKKAGINRNDLREIAVNNLTRFLPQIKTLDNNGVYMVSGGGNYESSLILCRKFWSRIQFPVKGDLIAALPSKDIVLVTGSSNKKGMEQISTLAGKIFKESTCPLVTDLFTRDTVSGEFKKYAPELALKKTKTGAKRVANQPRK